MSREIKFRIFNKKTKKIVYNLYLGKISDANCNNNLHGVTFSGEPKTEDIIFEDCIHQQFTGLLDKNGVEVYEGDIVEYFDWCYANDAECKSSPIKWDYEHFGGVYKTYSYYPCIGEVKWNKEYLTYEPLIFSEEDYSGNSFGNVCIKISKFLPNSRGLDNYPPSYFKVIGNIYQNPELLNNK